jgi:glycosyltransferase involved in cell wall biosynthesis
VISVVIATSESERPLVHTLAALVPGALAALVRDVVVADAGSRDATAKVADLAGCHFIVTPGPLGARLAAAVKVARGDWLLFLHPGSVPETGWLEEIDRFLREREQAADAVAVFGQRRERDRSSLAEAWARVAAAFGGSLPKPGQGLLISRSLYDNLGGHDVASADPETDLLRRIGRRRIVLLGCTMAQAR